MGGKVISREFVGGILKIRVWRRKWWESRRGKGVSVESIGGIGRGT